MSRTLKAITGMLLAVAVILLLPPLAARLMQNAGTLALLNALTLPTTRTAGYPLYDVLHSDTRKSVVATFQAALTLDDSVTTRWGLARADLAYGDAAAAAVALMPVNIDAAHYPLLFLDKLASLSYGGYREQAIRQIMSATLPYQAWPLQSRMIADSAVFDYLQKGQPGDWLIARSLQPANLYVNYMLWKRAKDSSDMNSAAVYSQTLTNFRLESVHPTDERLLDYSAPTIANLLNDGLWDHRTALNAVAFLVWQHPRSDGVERALRDLSTRYPDDPDWSFYLAELYQRRGNMERAADLYQHVLALDPEYTVALFRLALVNELQGRFNQAADWYVRYLTRAPDDPLALRRLAELYGRLGHPDAEMMKQRSAAATDDRRFVVEHLGLQAEDVELGPNLIQNGNFDSWVDGSPIGWRLGHYLGKSGDQGLYFAGEDDLIPGEKTARIIALWGGLMPDGTTTFAEYVGNKQPIASTKYLVSVYYSLRTTGGGTGLVFAGDYANAVNGFVLANQTLPDTAGQWRIVRTIVDGAPSPTLIDPLVRNWGAGDQQVQLAEIRSVMGTKMGEK